MPVRKRHFLLKTVSKTTIMVMSRWTHWGEMLTNIMKNNLKNALFDFPQILLTGRNNFQQKDESDLRY